MLLALSRTARPPLARSLSSTPSLAVGRVRSHPAAANASAFTPSSFSSSGPSHYSPSQGSFALSSSQDLGSESSFTALRGVSKEGRRVAARIHSTPDGDSPAHASSSWGRSGLRTRGLSPDVWPPPASYKSKGAKGTPLRPSSTAIPPARSVTAPIIAPEGGWKRVTIRNEADGPLAGPQGRPFKKVKHFAGGVSGGVPSWIRSKQERALADDDYFAPSSPSRHDSRSGSFFSEAAPRRPRPSIKGSGINAEDYSTPRTLSIFLLRNKYSYDDALRLVRDAPGDVGLQAGVWNTLITIALKERNTSLALRTYNDMKKRGIKPSDRTYSILLSNLPRTIPASSATVSTASSLYSTISRLMRDEPHEYPPSIIPINSYLSFLARCGQSDTCLATFDHLPRSGPLSPDVATWTSLFQALLHRDDVSYAIAEGRERWLELVDRVSAPGSHVRVDGQLLSTFVRLLLRGTADDQRLALALVRAHFSFPDNVTLPSLPVPSTSPASSVLPPAVQDSNKLVPGEQTLETIFNLLLRLELPETVTSLYSEYLSTNPKLLTNELRDRALLATVQTQDPQSAWRFCESKAASNAYPTLVSFHLAMDACAAAGNFDIALNLFRRMTAVRQGVEHGPDSRLARSALAPLVDLSSQMFPPDPRFFGAFLLTAIKSHPQGENIRSAVRLVTAFNSLTSLSVFGPHANDNRVGRPPTDPFEQSQVGKTRKTIHRQFYQRKLASALDKAISIALRKPQMLTLQEISAWQQLQTELAASLKGSHLEERADAARGDMPTPDVPSTVIKKQVRDGTTIWR